MARRQKSRDRMRAEGAEPTTGRALKPARSTPASAPAPASTEESATSSEAAWSQTASSETEAASEAPAAAATTRAVKRGTGRDYTMAHTSSIFLIDRAGRLRALMPFGHDPADFVHDVKLLLAQ